MSHRKRTLIAAAILLLAAPSAALANFPSIKGGKFEVTCKYVRSAQVDPIVSPGIVPSAHLHDFFGNKNIDQNSTPDSLTGKSTSCVLTKDSAGYWVPAAYRTDTGAQIIPRKVFSYYFGTAGTKTEPIPFGAELVAGDAHRTSAYANTRIIGFNCGNGGSGGNKSPTKTAPYNCLTTSGVVNSQGVTIIVNFPYCWDGSGVAQPDFSYGDAMSGACLAPFTHTLPQIQEHVHYGNSAGDKTAYQRGDLLEFASGPYYTLHADYLQSWVQTKMVALTAGCTAIFKDCGFVTDSSPGPGGK